MDQARSVVASPPLIAGPISTVPAVRVTARGRRHGFLTLCAATLVVAATTGPAQRWLVAYYRGPLPAAPAAQAVHFADRTPMVIEVEAGGQRAPWATTVDDLRSSVTTWRRLHLAQWNAVPEALRRDALGRMVSHYRELLVEPRVWDTMGPADWDAVPQPVRTVAFRHMTDYWTGYYDVGARYALPARLAADTLGAIVMSESWFDHRARYVNADGSDDVGLGGASAFARARMRQLHAAGLADIGPEDAGYQNPWVATRVAALWLSFMLDESGGELDLAVRAYNRGRAAADDALGARYLATVQQRLRRFIGNHEAPPAWADMWTLGRALERESWPWLREGSAVTAP